MEPGWRGSDDDIIGGRDAPHCKTTQQIEVRSTRAAANASVWSSRGDCWMKDPGFSSPEVELE